MKIYLLGQATKALNIFDTIYIEINNTINILQPFAPNIQIFLENINLNDCRLLPSENSVLVLCRNSYTLYDFACESICYNLY